MRVTGRMQLVSVGWHAPGPGWHLDAHLHPFHEIIVVMKGSQRIAIDGRDLRARAGDALLYPAQVPHEEWALPGEGLRSVFVSFHWRGPAGGLPFIVGDERGRMAALATWLHDERDAYHASAPAARESFLRSLVLEYVRSSSNGEHTVVERVRAYVRAHLRERISLDDLAREGGLSRFHFVRAYRALTGETPMRDLRRIRLEAARTLLLTTDLPLKVVAPRVGFKSEYHLSRVFKVHFGLGARDLRRRVAPTR